jgi:hypothetical protein
VWRERGAPASARGAGAVVREGGAARLREARAWGLWERGGVAETAGVALGRDKNCGRARRACERARGWGSEGGVRGVGPRRARSGGRGGGSCLFQAGKWARPGAPASKRVGVKGARRVWREEGEGRGRERGGREGVGEG